MSAPIPDEQAALLAAICACPDEDTPRLVYADWLQEHGDEEQAQFIRDSIQIEWLADHEDDKRQEEAQRLDEIETSSGARWLESLEIFGADAVYDRGMIDAVIYKNFETFWGESGLLFDRVPVRAVTISRLDGYKPLRDLAQMPELARLRELRLSNDGCSIMYEEWKPFITSPHLANLQVLSVRARLSDGALDAFKLCDHFANLEELDLSANGITATGALAVVQAGCFPRLRRLGLAYNNIYEDRSTGSVYLAMENALHERFDGIHALSTSL